MYGCPEEKAREVNLEKEAGALVQRSENWGSGRSLP